MIETGELKKGSTIEIDGTLYQVIEVNHLKVGRGSAQVRMKLRDVRAGHIIDKSVQAGFHRQLCEAGDLFFRVRFAADLRFGGHG